MQWNQVGPFNAFFLLLPSWPARNKLGAGERARTIPSLEASQLLAPRIILKRVQGWLAQATIPVVVVPIEVFLSPDGKSREALRNH